MNALEKIERPARKFLPDTFRLTDWLELKPWFDSLLNRNIQSISDLRTWFTDRSELEAVIAEDFAWRYINMTRFTENEDYSKSYQYFVENIQPQIAPVSDQLNRKAEASTFLKELEREPGYNIMVRSLKKDIELFREENIPVFTEISLEQQKYNQLSGAMMVEFKGQELTLQQAAVKLMSTDRAEREEVYHKITARRLQDKETLDQLFTRLIALRHQVAVNAGFANFRDYMFKAMGRFDYTPQDCFNFHDSVASEVVPMLNDLIRERKESLGVASLKPWDKAVDPEGRDPLKAFNDGHDLTEKTIECFHRIDPYLGQCLSIMKEMGHLDLESRKGKAPGGYNYPLAEIGVPFIFMNATSTLRDMVTLMHEGGHAVHNFLTRELELNDFKSTPSEVAELASMSMELISMDEWDIFFPDAESLKRAKREHLEDIIETLPWVATIDKFQHWIYENPNHSVEERRASWNKILTQFSDSITDWTGEEIAKDYLWQKQLHLYEVPFYYIEYGMAQLGAVAIWRNYKKNKQKGLQGYMNALKLGYMKSIPEVYEAAGIRFDFSLTYIRELMGFVKAELQKV
ncbi:MAG: M3 family oligoendopeptidase [Cyclobacteriaceae bacterium]|nr:M3 family oligoendopeptidase [Cyclobacteriaceae bacterium]UYN85927.1 MAG: M3 family oligoendopeptidase [Cyclobacteriaceae bacterium]